MTNDCGMPDCPYRLYGGGLANAGSLAQYGQGLNAANPLSSYARRHLESLAEEFLAKRTGLPMAWYLDQLGDA